MRIEIQKRENLYADYLTETSQLLAVAFDDKKTGASDLLKMNSLRDHINLITSSQDVIDSTGQLSEATVNLEPNNEEAGYNHQLAAASFTLACREELEKLKSSPSIGKLLLGAIDNRTS